MKKILSAAVLLFGISSSLGASDFSKHIDSISNELEKDTQSLNACSLAVEAVTEAVKAHNELNTGNTAGSFLDAYDNVKRVCGDKLSPAYIDTMEKYISHFELK